MSQPRPCAPRTFDGSPASGVERSPRARPGSARRHDVPRVTDRGTRRRCRRSCRIPTPARPLGCWIPSGSGTSAARRSWSFASATGPTTDGSPSRGPDVAEARAWGHLRRVNRARTRRHGARQARGVRAGGTAARAGRARTTRPSAAVARRRAHPSVAPVRPAPEEPRVVPPPLPRRPGRSPLFLPDARFDTRTTG